MASLEDQIPEELARRELYAQEQQREREEERELDARDAAEKARFRDLVNEFIGLAKKHGIQPEPLYECVLHGNGFYRRDQLFGRTLASDPRQKTRGSVLANVWVLSKGGLRGTAYASDWVDGYAITTQGEVYTAYASERYGGFLTGEPARDVVICDYRFRNEVERMMVSAAATIVSMKSLH